MDMTQGPRTVAVMQPYFYPYAGYFRLLAQADAFVILDDVQFPRRGRVHRCQVPGPGGTGEEWLTLPLQSQAREVQIRALLFADGAQAAFRQRLDRLPWIAAAEGPLAGRVREHLYGPLQDVPAFLEQGLRLVADALGLRASITRSSELELDPGLRGQERIIAIAAAHAAEEYLNSPGGRELYDPAAFAAEGMRLRFLDDYRGRYPHLLPALLSEGPQALRADLACA